VRVIASTGVGDTVRIVSADTGIVLDRGTTFTLIVPAVNPPSAAEPILACGQVNRP
jgi:hypothetical protein